MLPSEFRRISRNRGERSYTVILKGTQRSVLPGALSVDMYSPAVHDIHKTPACVFPVSFRRRQKEHSLSESYEVSLELILEEGYYVVKLIQR
jgi:hypothetical protein